MLKLVKGPPGGRHDVIRKCSQDWLKLYVARDWKVWMIEGLLILHSATSPGTEGKFRFVQIDNTLPK